MAKIVKDTRKTIDIDTELENIKKEKEIKEVSKENKKDNKKKEKKNKKTKKSFLKEVRDEMKLVKWPSKKDMIKYSSATISFVIFFSLFFYLIDLVMSLLLKAGA